MKKIYSLLLLIIFTSCSVSPNSTPNSRKGDIVQDADITMIDSSFNIKYYSGGKRYLEDYITVGNGRIVFSKRWSCLISISVQNIVEGQDTIERVYHFDDETHRLSHSFTKIQNKLHGMAVYYTDSGEVEKLVYYDEEGEPTELDKKVSVSLIKKACQETIYNNIDSLKIVGINKKSFNKVSIDYYKRKGKGILFIGTLCFVIGRKETLEAIFTQCSRRGSHFLKCGEGYYFDSVNHYLQSIKKYENNMQYGKILYLDKDGIIEKISYIHNK